MQFSIPLFDEDYNGPVLIAGPAVADLLSGAILRGQENIMANDQIQKLTGYQFNRATQFDSKIGKPVVHESLSVKAKPKLREFQGVDLLGSFPVDNEGVVPADEEVVISHGVLKALLNNRTLTSPSQRANGFSNGPGVIEVTSTMGDTEKQLKDKLLAKAKAAGLDYAIIIRDRSLMGTGFMIVNKIYVDMVCVLGLTVHSFAQDKKAEQKNGAVITWEKKTHDFGSIVQGDKTEHTFYASTPVKVKFSACHPQWSRTCFDEGLGPSLFFRYKTAAQVFGRLHIPGATKASTTHASSIAQVLIRIKTD